MLNSRFLDDHAGLRGQTISGLPTDGLVNGATSTKYPLLLAHQVSDILVCCGRWQCRWAAQFALRLGECFRDGILRASKVQGCEVPGARWQVEEGKVREQGQGASCEVQGSRVRTEPGCPSLRTCSVGSSQACDGEMARWQDGSRQQLSHHVRIVQEIPNAMAAPSSKHGEANSMGKRDAMQEGGEDEEGLLFPQLPGQATRYLYLVRNCLDFDLNGLSQKPPRHDLRTWEISGHLCSDQRSTQLLRSVPRRRLFGLESDEAMHTARMQSFKPSHQPPTVPVGPARCRDIRRHAARVG